MLLAFGKSADSALLGSVALALSNKGQALNALNRPEEALAAYDEVVRLYGESQSSEILEAVAKALLNKANALVESERHECALSVCDEIVTRFTGDQSLRLRESVATALCNKGIILGKLGRHEQALPAYDLVTDSFRESTEPVLVEMVAKSLLNKGYALTALGRITDALAAYDEAEIHARERDGLTTQALAIHALVKKGHTLAELDRPSDALPIYEEVIHRHRSSGDPELRRLVAMAFLNKGAALATLKRTDEAVEAFDAVVHRYGASETLPVLESVAKALVNKAGMLLTASRGREAIYVCDEVVRRFGAENSPVLAFLVADAFYVKGGALLELKRPRESLAPFNEVLRRSSQAETSAIAGLQAKALLGRALAFDRLGNSDEALRAYNQTITNFGEHSDPLVHGSVASALANKVALLDAAGRRADALLLHEDLLRRLGPDAPSYEQLIEQSIIARADFHLIYGRYQQAIEEAGRALDRCRRDSTENRQLALSVRAKATLANGDPRACERDITDILATFVEHRKPPNELLKTLIELSVGIGYGRMRALIESSPSATALKAHSIALAQEEGLKPRVARDVEETVANIRQKLTSFANDSANSSRANGNQGQIHWTANTSGIVITDKKNRQLPIANAPVRLAVKGKGGLRSNSWKIWMEKTGEIYLCLREDSPGFKVSFHKSGKQHIKMANEYWGQWSEPQIYSGPTVATSAKLIVPAWGMREDADLTDQERKRWAQNEIEIDSAREGRLLVVSVIVRTRGQQLKQEGGKSETLALWHRPDGKEAHLIVSEEAERNFGKLVLDVLKGESFLQQLNKTVHDGKISVNSVLNLTLAGPANEGGNYFMCVSTKVQSGEGTSGTEYVPIVIGLENRDIES